MSEDGHAILSPSGAERWSVCPGSVVLEADFPDNGNEHSDWGTAAHAVAAMCLTEKTDAMAYLGRRIDVAPARTVECDREMVETVQTYVDYVREASEGAELLVEQRLAIDHITGEVTWYDAEGNEVPEGTTGVTSKPAKGTTDAAILRLDEGELHIVDLKGGRGVKVFASYNGRPNKQLAMYALAALRAFELLGDFKRVRMTISQPRLNHLDEWDCSVEELLAIGEELSAAAKRASLYIGSTTPPSMRDLQPGEKQCKFCKARGVCPKLAETVQEIVGADFEDLTADAVNAAIPLGGEKLGAAMSSVELVEIWCQGVRAAVDIELLAGRQVPGWKLVQGRKGARQWASENDAETTLKGMRLKVEEMYSFKLITPPAAEKLVKAGTIGPRQWDKLKKLVTQSEGSPSVVPESDPREALVITPPEDDFEQLGESTASVGEEFA